MNIKKGAGILLCPKGKAFSMVSDAYFEATSLTGFETAGPVEMDPKDWGDWAFNVKRRLLKYEFTADPSPSIDPSFEQIQTQWKFLAGDEKEENKGRFPFIRARNFLDQMRRPLNDFDHSFYWNYFEESTGNLPPANSQYDYELFIHRNKFYFRHWYFPFINSEFTITFTGRKLTHKQDFDDDFSSGSITNTLEILETFPNK
jgi:hypothetical protein